MNDKISKILMDVEQVAVVLEKARVRVTHLLLPHIETEEKEDDKPNTAGHHLVDGGEDVSAQ